MEEKTMFLIEAKLLEGIGNYLAKQPFAEVVNFMNGIMACKPAVEPKKEGEPAKP